MENIRELVEAVRTELGPTAAVCGVDVQRGVLVLTGAVPTWAEKVAAQDAAFRVPGVRDVANALCVDEIEDDPALEVTLAAEARRAIDEELGPAGAELRILAAYDVITLRGAVDTHPQREAAWHAVRKLYLARTVRDEIAVAPPAVTPEQLREAIEGALVRHVAREAHRLGIDVEGGCVTVRGTVETPAAKAAVLGAVGGLRGITDVCDRVIVVGKA